MPRNIREDITRRSWTIAVGIMLLAIVVAWKIVYTQQYQTYKGKPWVKYLNQTMHIDTVEAMRGNIYSADGSLLATSLPYYKMSIDPTLKIDKKSKFNFEKSLDTLCRNMVSFFGEKTYDEYYRQVMVARRENDHEVTLHAKPLTLHQYLIVSRWPFFRKFKNSNQTRGGKLALFYRRYKPFGSLAVVGSINAKTEKGDFGLEARFQKDLAGTPAVGYMAVLDDGTRMPLEDDATTQPESGFDVYTTIDVNFQDIAETALRRTLQKYQADFGTAVVMEVKTGAIRAMANLGKSRKDTTYSDNYNYALAFRANPGSTFKTATMLAAMEEGRLNPTNTVETGNGSVRYHGVNVEDTHANGTLTVQEVLEKSSNVGVHKIMERSGFYENQQRYVDFLERFGLRNRTQVDMLGEARPVVHGPKKDKNDKTLWSKATSPTFVSYGYEWEYTPLQMLAFYNAIANDGYWVKPQIVTKIAKPNDDKQLFEVEQRKARFCTEKSLAQVRKMLEGVVANGTARNIWNPNYGIAGKTGTAQIFGRGGYLRGRYNVSFIGYFPAKKPKYSCIVWVSYPKGKSEGELFAASVAAPVFKEISDRIIGYDTNMYPPLPNIKNKTNAVAQQFRKGNADDLRAIADGLNTETAPNTDGWVASKNGTNWKNEDIDALNLVGMSLRDAVYLLENKGFRVNFKGKGKVKEAAKEGSRYLLTLE